MFKPDMEELNDIDFIQDLIEEGPGYIDVLYSSVDENDKMSMKQFSKYEILFLTEDDIFNDNIKLYCDYLIQNQENNLWSFMSKNCDEDELLDCVDKITKFWQILYWAKIAERCLDTDKILIN